MYFIKENKFWWCFHVFWLANSQTTTSHYFGKGINIRGWIYVIMNSVLFRFCFSVLFVTKMWLTNGEMVFIKPGIIPCSYILIKDVIIFIINIYLSCTLEILFNIQLFKNLLNQIRLWRVIKFFFYRYIYQLKNLKDTNMKWLKTRSPSPSSFRNWISSGIR